ncbi:MAG: hypothetical protein K8R67_06670 [Desulfobacteraceae bacterium]|nr:hypothetical protein [Desulfobacteraceae bacterium]
MKIYFILDIDEDMNFKHCIETKIKKLYNYKITQLLKKEKISNRDSDEFELLKYALENFNFFSLRLKCEINKKKSDNKVVITKEKNILIVTINEVQILQEHLSDK